MRLRGKSVSEYKNARKDYVILNSVVFQNLEEACSQKPWA